jgi:cationic amino acid transporter 14
VSAGLYSVGTAEQLPDSRSTLLDLLTGRSPDFLAFVITILMMLLMAAGVKKSLVFNNVLNALNLSVWVFVMTAGLFYVDTGNWSDHKGFLPYGWPGVSGRNLLQLQQ